MAPTPASTLATTNLAFTCHTQRRQGKVRDVYVLEEAVVALVATDRVSAFDVVFQESIPHKGQVLNQLAVFFLEMSRGICLNHFIASPDPNVTLGVKADVYPVEVIVRGHLCGHAWREYRGGKREVCGVALPDGLRENDPLPEPILTPTTKSLVGHDVDITEHEILKSGLIPADEWQMIKHYAFRLFEMGQNHARGKGLLLADTKYEFGNRNFDILLIDEIHTPDSSRYFVADGFHERQEMGEEHAQLSKEHLRKWLIANGFHGQEGVSTPRLSPDIVEDLSQRYIEVYERMTGQAFAPFVHPSREAHMQAAICAVIAKMGLQCC